MLQTHGGHQDNHADSTTGDNERGRDKSLQPLSLPKNRSTGNLALLTEPIDRSRYRMSFEVPASFSADHDPLTRSVSIPSPSTSMALDYLAYVVFDNNTPISRSNIAKLKCILTQSVGRGTVPLHLLQRHVSFHCAYAPFVGGPTSPNFAEDLSRFPSESLHSFSFAHQSEDFLHNRQNVLKRSMEFMKDRMGLSISSAQAGLASAQARVTGDVDAQNMLELLARAQVIGAGNLPNPDPSATSVAPPLTGPAYMSGENIFERQFVNQRDSDGAAFIHLKEPAWSKGDKLLKPAGSGQKSQDSSRTPTAESETTTKTSPPTSRPTSLKRTMTDTLAISLQDKLMDTMAQPFLTGQPIYEEPLPSPTLTKPIVPSMNFPSAMGSAVHGHTNRWVPAAQAIFTTEAKPPWTILAANDLACLVFGVTKAEVRRMGILEVVQEERRAWLERKLLQTDDQETEETREGAHKATPAASAATALLGGRAGITAQLLSKPNSRTQTPKLGSPRRAQTVHSGDPNPPAARGSGHHRNSLSRGVLLCGDVVPIQKRNGATGSASLWVKEKRIGLIWVLEEIHEDVANLTLDEDGIVQAVSGAIEPIWGFQSARTGYDVAKLIPRIPRQGIDPNEGEIDFAQTNRRRYFTCPNSRHSANIPCSIEQVPGKLELRISTFPHMAGIVVVEPDTLKVRSSNSVFSGALFGYEKPDGLPIDSLIPDFDKILATLTEEDGLQLLDGMVVPEHRFRRASAFLALKEQRPDAAAAFLQPEGIPGKHRDGSELKIDVQMRVVESEKHSDTLDGVAVGSDDGTGDGDLVLPVVRSELVFALWITYSRHLHTARMNLDIVAPSRSGASTPPPHQPSPGQTPARTPMLIESDSEESKQEEASPPPTLTKQLKDAALSAAAKLTGQPKTVEPAKKATIDDYVILEDMGQGAYGQVKLARHKQSGLKVVLKYVTKRRILVDTWTRDRKLGTVPLEIHVLDYLRKPEFRHPNIVEMQGFFEDDVNYYIEMEPHGLPGMDLFDYIELRANMDESECRNIFIQVVKAVHFLHTTALVVHRDIKDENVILDGEGNIKLIDFGSAAYVKSGPFDVFVGTIDYAAPEVLAGKPYGGKEQDVWALGILLYTIIYKENPFYSIDEIMDRDLRVPFTISDESIDLIRCMLNRDVEQRYTIEQVLDHPWFKKET
ncbi:Serine/threonine-protein kinase ppk6 [Cladobotryum mycophilum]|uniref:Serine/threonine-protein kinase ppk6 n=1 Tax=Cladobotryum mycophilum TaxID=491253 RepID=A0ABR0SDK4_9HYPO